MDVAVAERDERQTQRVEIAHAVVGHIPAEHVVPDLIVFLALVGPLLRGPRQIRRNGKAVLLQQCLELFDDRIDFGPFHTEKTPLPFILTEY